MPEYINRQQLASFISDDRTLRAMERVIRDVNEAIPDTFALKADLDSPDFTGTPTAPTASAGTSTDQIATTGFVIDAITGAIQKSVTGGTLTLTTAEVFSGFIQVVGTLTSNLIVEVPAGIIKSFIFLNSCTVGAYSVSLKVVDGTLEVPIAATKWKAVISNGVDLYTWPTDLNNPYLRAATADTIRTGDSTNYTNFDSTGHQTMVGNARPWRDELTDALNIRSTGTGVSVNNTESTVEFTASAVAASDYCFLNIQLNHDKDLASSIYPHIHFFQANNNTPNFILYYRWQVNGGAKVTAWSPLICNSLAFTYVSGTLNQIAYSVPITPPVGSTLSDIVQFRIGRDTGNVSTLFAGADPYTGTVGFMAFDVHFMINSLGSTDELSK